MRVRGFESSINIIPRPFAGVQWNSRINFAMNRAKILELPVPPFLFSTAQVGAVRIEKGKSPTQLIGNDTVSVADKTPDGRDSVGLRVGQIVRRPCCSYHSARYGSRIRAITVGTL